LVSATVLEHAPLEAVYIYFDTATYDEIEKDEKVTMKAQLGLIGGTMGLLTGFSILSGVEIVYYLLRFCSFSVATFQFLKFLVFLGFSWLSRPQERRWCGCCQKEI